MEFLAYGHAGIEGTNKSALEITQLTNVIPKGDVVIGTRSNFDPAAVAALAQVSKKLKITLRAGRHTEVITGDCNPKYSPGQSLIVRKQGTATGQTLIMNADKAAADLSRALITQLKNPETHLIVLLERLA
jgi:hypothetical protein